MASSCASARRCRNFTPAWSCNAKSGANRTWKLEPVTGFVVAGETGGQVLGAFDGARLVGYTLALVGFRDGVVYLHSHHTGVHQDYRDRGVGRMLKLFQREEALGAGNSFYPMDLRPAGIAQRALQSEPSGSDLPSLQAESLRRHHQSAAPRSRNGSPSRGMAAGFSARHCARSATLSRMTGERAAQRSNCRPIWSNGNRAISEQVKCVQDRIRAEFTDWFARGYAAIGMRETPAGAAYLLAPWSDF